MGGHAVKMRRLYLLACAVAATAIPAAAQDVEAGYQLARRWCSACHQLGRDPVGNVVSPPFAEIARMPSTTSTSLHAFLATPHIRMPDYSLTPKQADDVTAYILSLK